jgi:hypothetical protein
VAHAPRHGEDVTQKRVARLPKAETAKRDDRSAALALLASVGVTPKRGWAKIEQAGLLFKNAQAAADERDAAEAAKLRDRAKMVKALSGVELVTESEKGIREALLRDLRGEFWPTIGQVQRGWKPSPPIAHTAATKQRGRRVDLGIERTIRDFEAVYGWNWQTCAAAVFLSGVSTYSYEAIKKSFRAWNRRHRRSGTVKT